MKIANFSLAYTYFRPQYFFGWLYYVYYTCFFSCLHVLPLPIFFRLALLRVLYLFFLLLTRTSVPDTFWAGFITCIILVYSLAYTYFRSQYFWGWLYYVYLACLFSCLHVLPLPILYQLALLRVLCLFIFLLTRTSAPNILSASYTTCI